MKNESGLVPLGRAILCEPYEPERTRASSVIIIPPKVLENERTLDHTVRIVDVGPLAWSEEPVARAAIGDVVMLAKFSGHMAVGPLDGKPYRFVNDRDVFARVEVAS